MIQSDTYYYFRTARQGDEHRLSLLAQQIGSFGHLTSDTTKNRSQVEDSEKIAAGRMRLDQADIIFITEKRTKNSNPMAGTCKLGRMAAACWSKVEGEQRRHHSSSKDMQDVVSDCTELQFEAWPLNAIEFGGNRVSPELRKQGVGAFQTAARLLFLKKNANSVRDMAGNISCLCSSLRTCTLYDYVHSSEFKRMCLSTADEKTWSSLAETVGMSLSGEDSWLDAIRSVDKDKIDYYPFYEQVVRPLLGSISYDDADRYRYSNLDENGQSPFLQRMLGGTGKVRNIHLYIEMLRAEVRVLLGKVHSETVNAEKALLNAKFVHNGRFDILDAGPIYQRDVQDLVRCISTRTYCIRPLSHTESTKGVQDRSIVLDKAFFCPSKTSIKEFGAIYCLAHRDHDAGEILVDPSIYGCESLRGVAEVDVVE